MDLPTIREAVIKAVDDLLNTMIPMSYSPVEQYTYQQGPHLLGSIHLKGQLMGSLVVALPVSVAMAMTASLLQENISELNDDVYETVAEMTNILAGGIKTYLSPKEDLFELGLPQILELGHPPPANFTAHGIAVPIETHDGNFLVMSNLYEPIVHERN